SELQKARERIPPPAVADEGERKQGKLLQQARTELLHTENQYEEQERRWLTELVEARLRLMEAEDRLRMTERDQDPEEVELDARLKAQQKIIRRQQEVYSDKDDSRLQNSREAL